MSGMQVRGSLGLGDQGSFQKRVALSRVALSRGLRIICGEKVDSKVECGREGRRHVQRQD